MKESGKVKMFTRNAEGLVIEIDKSDGAGIVVACKTKRQAIEFFKEFDKRFPRGKGLIKRLAEIPFDD